MKTGMSCRRSLAMKVVAECEWFSVSSAPDLARRIDALEARYDEQFSAVFDAIKQLITDDKQRKAKPRIGFLD